jgi:uncharacterized membrane protein required for colicin V production
MQVDAASWFSGLSPFFAAAAETGAAAAVPAFGLFDVLLIIMAGLGIWRGKVRGISEELLDFLQWVVIVVAGGLLYELAGNLLVKASLSRLWANIGGYVLVAIAVVILFSFISKSVGNKLVDTDYFGAWEYRLGITAGAIRFLCIWIAVLAVLHARYYEAAQVEAERKAMVADTGMVLVPTWGMLNRMAFYDSFTGPYIRTYLKHQLITPVGHVKRAPSENTLGKQQQRVLDDVTGTAPKPAPAPSPEKK